MTKYKAIHEVSDTLRRAESQDMVASTGNQAVVPDKTQDIVFSEPVVSYATANYRLVKPVKGDIFLEREWMYSDGSREWQDVETEHYSGSND